MKQPVQRSYDRRGGKPARSRRVSPKEGRASEPPRTGSPVPRADRSSKTPRSIRPKFQARRDVAQKAGQPEGARSDQSGRPKASRPQKRLLRARVSGPRPPAGGAERRPLKTLDRVISKAGAGSRTEARNWIGTGRVQVNGKVIQTPDHWVDLERDQVSIDGTLLRPEAKRYLLLYKPKGYLTTYKDPENRPTIYQLLEGVGQFLSPVGRLDLETSGLLLLTNDSQLAERLTNPDYHVPKTYLVKAATLLDEEQLKSLRAGIELEDGPTRPAEVERVRDGAKHTFLHITLTEGRNRQVRRMLEAIGSRVLKLVRIRIGPLEPGTLQIGRWRELTGDEVKALKALSLQRRS